MSIWNLGTDLPGKIIGIFCQSVKQLIEAVSRRSRHGADVFAPRLVLWSLDPKPVRQQPTTRFTTHEIFQLVFGLAIANQHM